MTLKFGKITINTDYVGEQDMLCNELVGAGDVHWNGDGSAARLGARDRGHSALGKALGLDGAVDSALVVGRRWGGRCSPDEGCPRLLHGDGALGGLRRGLVRVRGCSRSGVRKMTGSGRVGVEDELLDSYDLLAVAELLQLAEQRLDLLDEGLSLSALELTKDLLC